MENKIILVDSDEAAKQITIPAWISSNGRILETNNIPEHLQEDDF